MLWGMTPDIILLWLTVALALTAMVVYVVESLRKIQQNKE
jgi:heme exporter protein D